MMVCPRCGGLASLAAGPKVCASCGEAMPAMPVIARVIPPAPRRIADRTGRSVRPGFVAGIAGCVTATLMLGVFLMALSSRASSKSVAITALVLGAFGLAFAVGAIRGRRPSVLGNAI